MANLDEISFFSFLAHLSTYFHNYYLFKHYMHVLIVKKLEKKNKIKIFVKLIKNILCLETHEWICHINANQLCFYTSHCSYCFMISRWGDKKILFSCMLCRIVLCFRYTWVTDMHCKDLLQDVFLLHMEHCG